MDYASSTEIFSGILTPNVTKDLVIRRAGEDAPLYAMLLAAGRVRPTNSTEIKYYERGMMTRTNKINNGAGYDDAATTWTVDDGSIFFKHQVVEVERTGENVVVTSVSGNDITVVRSIGDTAAAALVDNDDLLIVGTAYPEAQPSPDSQISARTEFSNYTQIFRKTASLSGTANVVVPTTNESRATERELKFYETVRDVEFAMIHGEKGSRTQDGEVQRFMQGILSFANENVTDQSGTMTFDEHEAVLEQVFQYGSKQKVAFVGPTAATALTGIYKAASQITVGVTNEAVGFTYSKIMSNHGELSVIPHPHLTGSIFGGYEIIVDLKNLWLRPLQSDKGNRSLQLREDVQAKGDDGTRDEWLGEYSLEMGSPAFHGVNYGITGWA